MIYYYLIWSIGLRCKSSYIDQIHLTIIGETKIKLLHKFVSLNCMNVVSIIIVLLKLLLLSSYYMYMYEWNV